MLFFFLRRTKKHTRKDIDNRPKGVFAPQKIEKMTPKHQNLFLGGREGVRGWGSIFVGRAWCFSRLAAQPHNLLGILSQYLAGGNSCALSREKHHAGGGEGSLGGSKIFCMHNLHCFPSNKPKTPKTIAAFGGRTILILITCFYLTFQSVKF